MFHRFHAHASHPALCWCFWPCIDKYRGLATCLPGCSAALIAYGLESFVDLFASVLVLWRFWDDASNEAGMKANLDREERANVGIAATFIIIAVITGGDAISHLVQVKLNLAASYAQ